MENTNNKREKLLSSDIRRTIILGRYIQQWGQPSKRTTSSLGNSPTAVEVYEFPGENNGLYRIATVGISGQITEKGVFANWEFLFCLPKGECTSASNIYVNYLLDIMAYSLGRKVNIQSGTTIPRNNLAPTSWSTKAILLDEARGEPEDMSCFHVGQQEVAFLWLVPITENEREFIKKYGLEKFDSIEAKSKFSLIDVNRQSMV